MPEIHLDLEHLKNEMNEKPYRLLQFKDRWIVNCGGAGSGKSYGVCQRLLLRILLGIDNGVKHRFLVLRKTMPAARKSVFELLKTYVAKWNLSDIVKIGQQEMKFVFANGSEIACAGMDDVEKIKSAEGLTGIWIEEATEFSARDFRQLNLRLRGEFESYMQINLTFNPIHRTNWLYKEFFDESTHRGKLIESFPDIDAKRYVIPAPKKGMKPIYYTVVRSNYKDNRFLDDDYISSLEQLKAIDKGLHTIYAKGDWGVLENVIYTNWDVVNDADWQKLEPTFDFKIYGLDFGYNRPNALLEIGFVGDEVYERELIYRNKMTVTDLIAEMKMLDIDRFAEIYADAADPASIEEIYDSDFNIQPSLKGHKSVFAGIRYVKSVKVHIHEDSINLIKEKQSYSWKTDKDENVMEEPVKYADHFMDAERYALHTHHMEVMAGTPGMFAIG